MASVCTMREGLGSVAIEWTLEGKEVNVAVYSKRRASTVIKVERQSEDERRHLYKPRRVTLGLFSLPRCSGLPQTVTTIPG